MEKVRLVYKKCGIHGKNTPRDKTLVISSPLLNIEGEFEVMLSGDVFFSYSRVTIFTEIRVMTIIPILAWKGVRVRIDVQHNFSFVRAVGAS